MYVKLLLYCTSFLLCVPSIYAWPTTRSDVMGATLDQRFNAQIQEYNQLKQRAEDKLQELKTKLDESANQSMEDLLGYSLRTLASKHALEEHLERKSISQEVRKLLEDRKQTLEKELPNEVFKVAMKLMASALHYRPEFEQLDTQRENIARELNNLLSLSILTNIYGTIASALTDIKATNYSAQYVAALEAASEKVKPPGLEHMDGPLRVLFNLKEATDEDRKQMDQMSPMEKKLFQDLKHFYKEYKENLQMEIDELDKKPNFQLPQPGRVDNSMQQRAYALIDEHNQLTNKVVMKLQEIGPVLTEKTEEIKKDLLKQTFRMLISKNILDAHMADASINKEVRRHLEMKKADLVAAFDTYGPRKINELFILGHSKALEFAWFDKEEDDIAKKVANLVGESRALGIVFYPSIDNLSHTNYTAVLHATIEHRVKTIQPDEGLKRMPLRIISNPGWATSEDWKKVDEMNSEERQEFENLRMYQREYDEKVRKEIAEIENKDKFDVPQLVDLDASLEKLNKTRRTNELNIRKISDLPQPMTSDASLGENINTSSDNLNMKQISEDDDMNKSKKQKSKKSKKFIRTQRIKLSSLQT